MLKGLNTCLVGQKSADGKGYSGKMNPKYLDELLKPKECSVFADGLMKFNKCQFLFEELIDHAGFKDPLDEDDSADDKADDMAADAMKADDMAADAMKADDMATDAMKDDAMKGMN
jgi:pentapeptide MXKDX repeat protein